MQKAGRRTGWGLISVSSGKILNVYYATKREAIEVIESTEGRRFNPKAKAYKHQILPVRVHLVASESE